MTPSKVYITVAHQVQEWILANHPPKAKPPGLVPFSYKPHKPDVAASDQGSLF